MYELFSGFIPDDAFYYYKTAHNIRNGFGSTFDTFNITNGYHPLWMVICVILAFITTDLYGYIYLVLGVNLLFVFLLSFQVFHMFNKSLGIAFGALLVCLMNWNHTSSIAIFSGLETPLYLWLLFLTVERMASETLFEHKNLLVLGGLAGLTFLARTEFVLFLPVMGGYLLYRMIKERPAYPVRTTARIAAPFLLLTLPYLAWNYSMMGHIQQISGLTKDFLSTSTPDTFTGIFNHYKGELLRSISPLTSLVPAFIVRNPPLYLFVRIINILPLLLILWFTIVALRYRKSLKMDERIVVLAIFSTIVICYYFISYGTLMRPWHPGVVFVTLHIAFVHSVKLLYDRIGKVYRPIIVTSLVLVMGIFFIHNPYQRFVYRYYNYHFVAPVHYQHEAAMWVRDNLPPDAIIGTWNAGYFGYFSERKVINLDGLINGRELYDYRRDGRGVWQYIQDHRIDYLSDYFFGDPPPPQSVLGPQLTLLYHVGRSDVVRDKQSTYIDWYVWMVNYDQ